MFDEHENATDIDREPCCSMAAEALGALVEHRLSPAEAAAVTAHLASCDSCRCVVVQLLGGADEPTGD